jgi:CrcB protein
METFYRCIAVALAGSVGAVARYLIGLLFGQLNIRFPLGTMFINLSGSFFLGWFLTYIAGRHVSDVTRLGIAVGFVGAYTTFSTFMYDSVKLLDEGAFIEGMVNIIASLILGLAAVQLGMWLGGHGMVRRP